MNSLFEGIRNVLLEDSQIKIRYAWKKYLKKKEIKRKKKEAEEAAKKKKKGRFGGGYSYNRKPTVTNKSPVKSPPV